MTLPDETEARTAGTQPCRGTAQWAHRDGEPCREDSFLRRPNPHRIEILHALKISARKAEYSLTENVASPFQAETRQLCELLKKTNFSQSCTFPFYGKRQVCMRVRWPLQESRYRKVSLGVVLG